MINISLKGFAHDPGPGKGHEPMGDPDGQFDVCLAPDRIGEPDGLGEKQTVGFDNKGLTGHAIPAKEGPGGNGSLFKRD
ncbi:MAG TPA: hypothetical protein VF399_02390 [bacterium]